LASFDSSVNILHLPYYHGVRSTSLYFPVLFAPLLSAPSHYRFRSDFLLRNFLCRPRCHIPPKKRASPNLLGLSSVPFLPHFAIFPPLHTHVSSTKFYVRRSIIPPFYFVPTPPLRFLSRYCGREYPFLLLLTVCTYSLILVSGESALLSTLFLFHTPSKGPFLLSFRPRASAADFPPLFVGL